MPHYVALLNWTEQGIRNVKDTIKRAENAKAMARKLGGKLDVWYTMGQHDIVGLIEMPNDEAYNKFTLWIGSQGNVRTTSLKAWTQEEISKLVDGIP
ncbi:MAG TPA: GYD domain-containing protein [Candidatus Binatus sp.]|nr:GYD domain-containing protein [Candidatus Binatus sp.]